MLYSVNYYILFTHQTTQRKANSAFVCNQRNFTPEFNVVFNKVFFGTNDEFEFDFFFLNANICVSIINLIFTFISEY